jgi:hypothetical protein
VRVDSTAAFVSTHRRGAGGLHDLSRCLETLRLTEASAYEGTGTKYIPSGT